MKSLPIPAALDRLSIGVSRLSIRRAHTQKRYKQPQPELNTFRPGHGEQIWVFNDKTSNQVVYSHQPVVKTTHALRQIPFNGKKMKPTKLRKDFWRPMAMIQFGEGEGVIGQSVFQKLREFRMLHELSWGWQAKELLSMSKAKRGRALNNQKANSIADMAAVLGGAGKGNRIWVVNEETGTDGERVPEKKLAATTVYWANELDMQFAKKWSKSVTHQLGLPRKPKLEEAIAGIEEGLSSEVGNSETAATPL